MDKTPEPKYCVSFMRLQKIYLNVVSKQDHLEMLFLERSNVYFIYFLNKNLCTSTETITCEGQN